MKKLKFRAEKAQIVIVTQLTPINCLPFFGQKKNMDILAGPSKSLVDFWIPCCINLNTLILVSALYPMN